MTNLGIRGAAALVLAAGLASCGGGGGGGGGGTTNPTPNLSYVLALSDSSVESGQATELAITATNTGAASESFSYTLTHPSGVSNASGILSSTCTGSTSAAPEGKTVTVSGATLAPGESCSVSVSVKTSRSGTFTFALRGTTVQLVATAPPDRYRVTVFDQDDVTSWENYRTVYQKGTAPLGLESQQFGACKLPSGSYVTFQCLYNGQGNYSAGRKWWFIAISKDPSVTLTFGNHINASVGEGSASVPMSGDLMELDDAIAVYNQTVASKHASESCADASPAGFKFWRGIGFSKGADENFTEENAEYRFLTLAGKYTDDLGNNVNGRFGTDWGGIGGITTVLDKASPQFAGIVAALPLPTINCGTLAPISMEDRFATVYTAFESAMAASGFVSSSSPADTEAFTFDGFRSTDGLDPSYYATEAMPLQTVQLRTYAVNFGSSKALADFRNKLLAKFIHPLLGGTVAEASLRMPGASDNESGGWTYGAGTATTVSVRLAIIDRYDDMAVVVSIWPSSATLGTHATALSRGGKLAQSNYWSRSSARPTVQ